MMPATCVPWPKPSPAVVAPGAVTTFATMRDAPLASRKSGMSPAMPVSMTATPTPRPVMPRCQSLSARVVFGYDVASWSAVRPVLWTRELSVRPTTRLSRRQDLGLLGRQLDGQAVDERHAAGDLAAVLARRGPWPCAPRTCGLNWTIAVTLRAGAFWATVARRDCADGAAWATVPPTANGTTAATRATVRPLRQRCFGETGQFQGTSVCSSSKSSKLAAELSHVRARPLALRPRLTTGLPFSALCSADRPVVGWGLDPIEPFWTHVLRARGRYGPLSWDSSSDRRHCAARREAGCRRARSRSATASTTTRTGSPARRCSTRAGA